MKREIAIELAESGNYTESQKLFEDLIKKGDKSAINDLGVIHERNKRYKYAMRCYQLGAMLGYIDPLLNAANLYEQGLGVKANLPIAIALYERGMELEDPRAFLKFGNLLLYKYNNKKIAVKAFKEGAKFETKGKYYGCSIQLAYCYENGIGVRQDSKKALEYLQKPIEAKHVIALYNSALILLTEKDVQNVKLGLEYMALAGKMKYPDACAELAKIYIEGKYVKKDPLLSDYWIRQAIKFNSGVGYIYLAEMYLTSENKYGKKDLNTAKQSIAEFIKKYGFDSDYQGLYEQFKKSHKDDLDFEELENQSSLSNSNDVAEC